MMDYKNLTKLSNMTLADFQVVQNLFCSRNCVVFCKILLREHQVPSYPPPPFREIV